MVTGHNKGDGGMHVFKNETGDENGKLVSHCELNFEHPNVQTDCKPTTYDTIDGKYMFLMSDTVKSSPTGAMYLQYATLKCTGNKFTTFSVDTYTCGTQNRCKVFGGLGAFKALIG
jgi:hypothetical protein